jgi:hypothetical protein
MPWHQGIRLISTNIFVIAWKDIVLLSALIGMLFYFLSRLKSMGWSSLFKMLLALLLFVLSVSLFQGGTALVLEASLYMFGSACSGFFIYNQISLIKNSLQLSLQLRLVFISGILLAIWMLLENPLNLVIMPDITETEAPTFERFDYFRAKGPFDSPMAASLYMWFFTFFGLGCALCCNLRRDRFLSATLSLLSCCAILIGLSRGPLVLLFLSFLVFVILSFIYYPLPFLKWSSLFLALILLAYLGKDFYLTFLETNVFKDLLSSVFDPSESSNSIRQDRWQAGINSLYNTFPFGRGVSFINEKALVGTGEIFENSWLCLHSGLGIIGLFYATFFFLLLVFFGFEGVRCFDGRFSGGGLCFLPAVLGLPLAIYMWQFPVLSSRFSAMIFWMTFGIGLYFVEQVRSIAPKDFK